LKFFFGFFFWIFFLKTWLAEICKADPRVLQILHIFPYLRAFFDWENTNYIKNYFNK
jgi:hypothetical protein